MIVSIFIGNTQLDLFKDENISLNSSVANIEDITKNQTDFTKTFTVPASSNNNKLFKHYYDADIDGGFDARIKVDGDIKLDGLPFRKGKFRLSKVSIKKGDPYAYTINFWGNLLGIKDKVGKDYLSDLANDKLGNPLLSNFDHSYDSATVKTGLQSGLFSGDVVYNLLVKKKYYYTINLTDTTITDTIVNIGYGDGSGLNGVDYIDLHASIRLIKIIEAIEDRYDITFSRDFFGLTEFTNIFTWLNPSKDKKAGGGSEIIDWTTSDSPFMNLTTNIATYPRENTYRVALVVTPDSGFEDVEYIIRKYNNEEIQHEITVTGNGSLFTVDPSGGDADNQVFYEISTDRSFNYTATLSTNVNLSVNYLSSASISSILSEFIVKDNLPKVKIIDFLKGLFNMFKLIVIVRDNGTIYVDTLNNYYLKGNLIDATRYIDFSSYDVERGKILNEINFLFKEPTTILNTQFEDNTRIAYGDEETILTDLDGEVLDGTKLEFTLPFETILFERLNDSYFGDLTQIQYGAIIDDSLEPVNPKMTLFYNINQPLYNNKLGYINDTGVKTLLTGNINTASHTDTFVNPNFSLLFGAEFSTWNGLKINSTLYKNYHENYILTIFNAKKRSYKYKAVLPLTTMLDMGLNDILQIKDSFYRIDNFTTNLTNGKVTLNLVNSFDAVIGEVQVFPKSFVLSSDSQTVSSSVTNSDSVIAVLVDVGYGTDWITTEFIDGNLFYTVSKNLTGLERFVKVEIQDSTSFDVIEEVPIRQLAVRITLDNSTMTLDNNIITLDSN